MARSGGLPRGRLAMSAGSGVLAALADDLDLLRLQQALDRGRVGGAVGDLSALERSEMEELPAGKRDLQRLAALVRDRLHVNPFSATGASVGSPQYGFTVTAGQLDALRDSRRPRPRGRPTCETRTPGSPSSRASSSRCQWQE